MIVLIQFLCLFKEKKYNLDNPNEEPVQVDEEPLVLEANKSAQKALEKAGKGGFLNATEVADYLVRRDIPFRDAHEIVGQIVIYCEDNNKAIEDLSLEELKSFSATFEEDIYEFIDYENILNKGIKKNLK